MTTFSVSPAQGFNPPTDEGFPQFIQFQADGANLGGPDADTLNFGSGLTATRGTGEHENEVTVTADGGGATEAVLAFFLSGSGAYGTTIDTWAHTAGVASADASWNSGANRIEFARTGIYEILVSSFLQLSDTDGHAVAYGVASDDGNNIPSSIARGAIDYQTVPSGFDTVNGTMRFVDITSSGADLVREIGAGLTITGEGTFTADLAITVRRLGDAP